MDQLAATLAVFCQVGSAASSDEQQWHPALYWQLRHAAISTACGLADQGQRSQCD